MVGLLFSSSNGIELGGKPLLMAFKQRGNTLAEVYTDAHITQILSLGVNMCVTHTTASTHNTKYFFPMTACVCLGSTRADISSRDFHPVHRRIDVNHDRYSPDTDSWSADVAPLSSPRSGVCLVAMDGSLYAIGGHDGITAMNTVER